MQVFNLMDVLLKNVNQDMKLLPYKVKTIHFQKQQDISMFEE